MNSQKMFRVFQELLSPVCKLSQHRVGFLLGVVGFLSALTFVAVMWRNHQHRLEVQAKSPELFAVSFASPVEFALFEGVLEADGSGGEMGSRRILQRSLLTAQNDFHRSRFHLNGQEVLSLFDYFSLEPFELAKRMMGQSNLSEDRYQVAVMESDVKVLGAQGLELVRRWSVLKRSSRSVELRRQLLGASAASLKRELGGGGVPPSEEKVRDGLLAISTRQQLAELLKMGAAASQKECSWLRLEKAFRLGELSERARPFVKDYFTECRTVNSAFSNRYVEGVLKAWN